MINETIQNIIKKCLKPKSKAISLKSKLVEQLEAELGPNKVEITDVVAEALTVYLLVARAVKAGNIPVVVDTGTTVFDVTCLPILLEIRQREEIK